MDGHATPRSGAAPAAGRTRRIRNTFSRADNEYFTPATLFSLCRYGFPFEKLPEEAKEMLMEYCEEYTKRCTHPGDEIKIASLDVPPEDQLR